MIHSGKRALLEGASEIFERGAKTKAEVDEETMWSLHAKVGELAVANVFWPYEGGRGPSGAAKAPDWLKPWTGK